LSFLAAADQLERRGIIVVLAVRTDIIRYLLEGSTPDVPGRCVASHTVTGQILATAKCSRTVATMSMAPIIVSSPEKLTLEEIERRYRDKRVLIVNYDFEFPKMKLIVGFVHAHGAGRAAQQPLAQNFRRCAVHWTGPVHDPLRYWRRRVVNAV